MRCAESRAGAARRQRTLDAAQRALTLGTAGRQLFCGLPGEPVRRRGQPRLSDLPLDLWTWSRSLWTLPRVLRALPGVFDDGGCLAWPSSRRGAHPFQRGRHATEESSDRFRQLAILWRSRLGERRADPRPALDR